MKETNGVQLVIRITSLAAAVCAIIASVLLKQSQRTEKIGTLLLISSVLVLVLLAVEYFFFAGSTRKYIAKSAAQLNKTEKESLLNFPAPAVIIDQDNCIVWYNKLFGRTVVKGEEPYGVAITELFKIDMDVIFSRDGDRVCKDGRFYNVRAIHTDHGEGMAMLYFADTTDLVELDYEKRQSHQSVIIIMIDYYEELISNIRESEKAHLLVSIEQLIENFIDGTTGISRRAGNDRFYVILEERYLQPIIEKRFEILEQARKIRVSDRAGITLSIGVGHDAKNLAESEKYAKKALDMCLGRGGDQAAVRTEEGYEFYGGQSKGMSKNTRVKSRMVANALVEIIGSYERVLVMGHQWGDLDSIGSAVGICDAIKGLGRESYVVVNRDRNLALTLIDHIEQNSIKTYFISPNDALAKLDDNTLLIITDTHNPAIVDSKELLMQSQHRVVIDHHRL
ncbi:MAG: DHH family phosphoesterase, partial [Ruminococcus sp.]|nr:DHH family phosphoesterase [Ruminococcus sp.]